MEFLPKVIEDTINDFKSQMEYTEKFNLCLNDIKKLKKDKNGYISNPKNEEIFIQHKDSFKRLLPFSKGFVEITYWSRIYELENYLGIAGMNEYNGYDENYDLKI